MATGEKKDTREALSSLTKDDLVARADALGIDGARKFTKLELVDEIIRASGSDRGLLGKARDLLRDVVERGLQRAVTPKEMASPPSPSSPPEPPVATITLAEIYKEQGHVTRAKAIADEILRTDPEDAGAQRFLESLASSGSEAPTVGKTQPSGEELFADDPYAAIGIEREAFEEPPPPKVAEVPAMLDDAPFPARYDVDECVAMAVDPTTIYVYWETRKKSIERARRVLKGEANSTLRVLVVEPTDKGPHVSSLDFDVIDLEYGEWFVRDLPAGSIVRAAIGVRSGERFLPIAHTLDVEAPWASPSKVVARERVIWSEEGTQPKAIDRSASTLPPSPFALERETGMLGLPPLPLAPEPAFEAGDEAAEGRGLSSAELARRRRISSARAALAAGPTSASFLGKS